MASKGKREFPLLILLSSSSSFSSSPHRDGTEEGEGILKEGRGKSCFETINGRKFYSVWGGSRRERRRMKIERGGWDRGPRNST